MFEKKEFPYAVIVPSGFNPAWRTLKDPKSVKAAIIHQLAVMHGYNSDERFVDDFKGLGKVTVEDSGVIISFIDLDTLGINTDSPASPEIVDRQLREWATQLANPQTDSEQFTALNSIIGTWINGFCTVPSHHPLYHRS